MTSVWALAALWFGLALLAGLASSWLRISTALSEIIVGMIASAVFGATVGPDVLGTNEPWVKTFAGAGAILLTFLAGAELDPQVFRRKWKEAAAVGLASFLLPAFGCAAAGHYLLGWQAMPSILAGIALAATSVAVVYTVMMEFGFNRTEFGKTILAACFVTDLGTVITLGLVFAPFTGKTLLFTLAVATAFVGLPWLTRRLLERYGERPSELETKFLFLCLLGMGSLATWAGSEAVLPAYLIGMTLAGSVGRNAVLIRRLRTVTIGVLTPFYFTRAGYLVSIPAVIAAPAGVIFFLLAEAVAKIGSVYPVAKFYGSTHKEAMYTTLLMSSGLTFGTIASLFGLSHGIIDKSQYSTLVAAIVGTAIIPTVIANSFFLPRHLLPKGQPEEVPGGGAGGPLPLPGESKS
ncbi:Glutathione-regulated potassium-efflux system protein KefC [Methylacidimicrobium cyclopophantes]|uniref:Glutathione-regulated potassium-efflux system protein KefC n=1 Tax=Methylacidimicrobium cyclopophantes TaxID=1041766 RepID=A0A5E6M9Y0_9BACT|nr:cation:proton antiporter [Methylacidimicrobium cyclopophantes]VVM06008.1 Glutathione-regulated potassium-efflux system protein KefC [Methylacidimicrobium cyclopophantes]